MKPILALLVAAMLSPAVPAAARSGSLFGSNDRYVNSKGRSTRSPKRSLFSSIGSSAKCRDGSSSYSRRSSGTCSGHGGVARFR